MAVIGAGPAGLCAARWLAEVEIPFDLIERHKDIGGIWDIDAPGSPMYESAHFISSKTLSGFRDFPMPAGYPDYPGHRQVLAYLRAYADRHRLRERAELGTAVRSVRPEAAPRGGLGAGECVTLELETGERRRYAAAIVATGLQWTPRLPELAKGFAGEALHASGYRSLAQLEGRRVLVVGGGNSGCDIAVDAGLVARRALLSVRRGYWFVPKHIFGMPADVFGARGPRLPGWLEQRVFEPLLRVLNGDVTRLGLPRPDHRLFQTHPVLNSQILHSLSHGDVVAKPDVRGFEGRRALFADGSAEELDLVVFATGYRRLLPVLTAEAHREGDCSELFLNVFHRRHPALCVVGFFETDAGSYPLIDLQCELIARVLDARRSGGRPLAAFDRRRRADTPDFSGGVRFLAVERMANYVRSRPYQSYLERRIAELREAR